MWMETAKSAGLHLLRLWQVTRQSRPWVSGDALNYRFQIVRGQVWPFLQNSRDTRKITLIAIMGSILPVLM